MIRAPDISYEDCLLPSSDNNNFPRAPPSDSVLTELSESLDMKTASLEELEWFRDTLQSVRRPYPKNMLTPGLEKVDFRILQCQIMICRRHDKVKQKQEKQPSDPSDFCNNSPAFQKDEDSDGIESEKEEESDEDGSSSSRSIRLAWIRKVKADAETAKLEKKKYLN